LDGEWSFGITGEQDCDADRARSNPTVNDELASEKAPSCSSRRRFIIKDSFRSKPIWVVSRWKHIPKLSAREFLSRRRRHDDGRQNRMAGAHRIRVMSVDDHPLMGEGIASDESQRQRSSAFLARRSTGKSNT
jgi:hypothetical protein